MPEKLWYDNEMICVHPWQVFCLYLICQTLTTTRAGHKTVNNYPAIKVLKHVTGWPLIVSWLVGVWILLPFDYAYVYSLRAVISTWLSVALLVQPSYLTLHDLRLISTVNWFIFTQKLYFQKKIFFFLKNLANSCWKKKKSKRIGTKDILLGQ